MICSALNYWTTCPRNPALTQLHTRRVLPGVPFWARSKSVWRFHLVLFPTLSLWQAEAHSREESMPILV